MQLSMVCSFQMLGPISVLRFKRKEIAVDMYL